MVYDVRLSSELFQHKTNYIPDYEYDLAIPSQINWRIAKRDGHRLTFHPGQYNILGSPKQKSLIISIKIHISCRSP